MVSTRSRVAGAVAAALVVLAGSLVVAASPAWAAPIAVDDAYSTSSGTPLTVPAPGVLGNDTGLPPNARATTAGPVPANADAFQLGTDGSVTYTPRSGFTGVDTFLYCVEGDGLGSCQSNAATVRITVRAPVAVDDAYSTASGTTLTVPAPGVLANDTGLPPNARATTASPVPANADVFLLGTDGSLTYTPRTGFTGVDTFLYCVEGGGLGSCQSNPATVRITVRAPVAVNDAYSIAPGATLTVPAPGVLANDTGLPPNARATTAGPVPANADVFVLGTDGSLTYRPTAGFAGTVSFLYCVEGGGQGSCQSNPATVTIRVQFTTPAPTRTLTGDVLGPVTVNAGESVLITGARVVGPVTVNAGGALTVVGSQISQGITANAPAFFSLCASQVSGPSTIPGRGVVVRNAATPVRIGDPATGCATNRVAGDVILTGNTGGLMLGANVVSGNVTVDSNAGAVVVKANTVFKTLGCSANNPAPTNAGQANTAAAKTGQCAGL